VVNGTVTLSSVALGSELVLVAVVNVVNKAVLESKEVDMVVAALVVVVMIPPPLPRVLLSRDSAYSVRFSGGRGTACSLVVAVVVEVAVMPSVVAAVTTGVDNCSSSGLAV
jgi:hypothetical protein